MIVYKNKITIEDCDIYEHMNTLKYIKKFYDAADVFLLQHGMSDPILAAQGIGCVYMEFNTKFIKEVFAGVEIAIDIKVKEKGSKVVTLLMTMINTEKEQTVSEGILKFLFFDLKKRKSIRLDDKLLENLNSKF